MQSTTSSTRTFMTTPPTPEPKKAPKPPRQPIKWPRPKVSPWVLVVALVLLSLFLYVQYRDAKRKLSGNTTSSQDTSVINKVRTIAVLPSGETPTVATVVNADKLKNQAFFNNAKNGDKVLVFNREKEAILYRPSTNQIVTIAPVTVSANGSNLTGQ